MATKTRTTKYEEAVLTLERTARQLDRDYGSVKQEALIPTIETVVGKSLSAFKRTGTIRIHGRVEEAIKHITMLRGVRLGLTEDLRLISITVSPEKLRERERLLSIVGIGHDPNPDVSARHDDYLAEIGPHGAS